MRSVVRLLDANANRAREAMRVMEDAARFLLDDVGLASDLKQLRHDFRKPIWMLVRFAPGLELHRDTPRDVGTKLSTAGERSRGSASDVVIAAGKRLGESLRCLEEYSKPYSEFAARLFKSIRYRGYELERRLHVLMGCHGVRQWRLCVIITESLCEHHDWFDVARAAVESGADCLQLREKNLEGRELLDRAIQLGDLSYERSKMRGKVIPSIIVNDRPDIAAMAWVDGVHLGQFDPPPDRVRQMIGPDRIIGVSTHNLAEARRAIQAGADYCGVGAIYPTSTKPRAPSGLNYLKQFLKRFPHTPHLAIGGITPENVGRVIDAGARGIAVSSGVCGARSPGKVVRRLLRNIPKTGGD